MSVNDFNSSGVGLCNGNFIGLPFTEETAKVVGISVPWDVTVSYIDGTANASENILKASVQLDLFQEEIPDAWKLGFCIKPPLLEWKTSNKSLREKAKQYIHFLESGGDLKQNIAMQFILKEINQGCYLLYKQVYNTSRLLINKGKLPIIVGGEHSTPLGLIEALHEKHPTMGILQIDAHMDLRKSYEDFTYSHASIFYNVLQKKLTSKLVQVGIRDYCDEEVTFAKENNVSVFYDVDLKSNAYLGKNWHEQCLEIIACLPQEVYVSFDIDGLSPHLCPNTGTPVPGGLEYTEAYYLIKQVVKSGRRIIGFDLCEVAGNNEWDGNVGARILYYLVNWMGRSQHLI